MIDWSKCITIDSGSVLQDIEHNFRVFAGPGAGKTHWLINHVRNVLRRSRRLGKTGKVACITYTNTGVEEIQKRLRYSAERAEICTIHSFLYNNVVKPYAFLLKDDGGKYILNIKEMDGHTEHIPSSNTIYHWKTDCVSYLNDRRVDDKKVYECLIDLDWCFQDEDLVCLPHRIYKLNVGGKYPIKRDALKLYKQYYWNLGQIHHEDVLFFSYTLIKQYPEILDFIRAKFPYIFIDEFQDTNPIQTCIVKKIAEEYTKVGVIGDLAQSIYGFQGARRQDFKEFILKDGIDYKIENNRRSTDSIIKLLNHMRGNDIKQISSDDKKGGPVILFIGSIHDVIRKIEETTGTLTVLARRNDHIAQIRSNSEYKLPELWDELRSIDKTWQRTNFIYSLIQAVGLAYQQDFKESITGLERNFRKFKDEKPVSKYMKRSIAVNCLQKAVNEWDIWKEQNLREFNNHFINYLDEEYNIKIGAAISRGVVKEFAEKWKCKDFEQCIKLKDDKNSIRTIHKAKGTQFTNVLVALEKESHLGYLINPDIDNEKDDECRLYYVALSRAIDNLFISTPSLNEKNKESLLAIDVEIHQLVEVEGVKTS